MGVKFKDIVTPENIKFQDLESKIVALDAANVIYQFLSSRAQIIEAWLQRYCCNLPP